MKAIIVGAGIGGLTAALALRRAGVETTVFERAEDVGAVQLGGGIHLWHNGMRGLERAGVADEVEALGGRAAAVERAEFSTAKGKTLALWPIAELEREVGAPTVGVLRPRLHHVLLGALEPGVLRLGAACTGFAEEDGGIVTRFEDGGEERGDVLVGADGLRSVIRAQLRGDEPVKFAGYASWQGTAAYGGDDAPPGVFRVIFGRGARFLHYRVDEKTVYWEGIYATSAGVQDPAGGRRQAALDRFAGWRTPVEAIIGATNETAINRSDIYTRPPIKEWGAGRVTLLGDAAHPMTNAMGQGANQAIEDAVVLARCLSQVDDPMTALREYERCRIGRSASFVKISSFMSKLSQLQQPAAVGARDLWFRVSLGTFVYRKVRKDMAYTF